MQVGQLTPNVPYRTNLPTAHCIASGERLLQQLGSTAASSPASKALPAPKTSEALRLVRVLDPRSASLLKRSTPHHSVGGGLVLVSFRACACAPSYTRVGAGMHVRIRKHNRLNTRLSQLLNDVYRRMMHTRHTNLPPGAGGTKQMSAQVDALRRSVGAKQSAERHDKSRGDAGGALTAVDGAQGLRALQLGPAPVARLLSVAFNALARICLCGAYACIERALCGPMDRKLQRQLEMIGRKGVDASQPEAAEPEKRHKRK